MSLRRSAGRAKTSILWGLIAYWAVHLTIDGVMERRHPEVHDPEHFGRLALLQARRAERPDAALLLLVGSSRTMLAFQPEALPTLRTADGRTILPFNFSHTGAGPLLELVAVRRLLDAGIRPDWLVIEVMPAYLAIRPNRSFVLGSLGTADWLVMKRYLSAADRYGKYGWERWLTELRYHRALAERWLRKWVQVRDELFPPCYGPLGGYGHLRQEMSPELTSAAWAMAKRQYEAALREFHVDPEAGCALEELLELCRREHIRVVLLVTPEASPYRGWYSAEAGNVLADYLGTIAPDDPPSVIDAREWLPDGVFYDGHHVLARGAQAFTHRMGQELPRILRTNPPFVACR